MILFSRQLTDGMEARFFFDATTLPGEQLEDKAIWILPSTLSLL